MAIQLRASSFFSSAPSTRSQRHDVFLSFIGEDTRDGFTGHLYDRLVRKGIKTFIDNDLTRGEEISQALLRAIEESKLSLIVFSEKYASSKWCLEELVHILKCRRLKNQMVQPIFYKVDPSDVRHQRGKFGESHADLERRFKDDMRKVLRWRTALSEAATLSGWHFSGGYEYEFIDKIVEKIFAQVYEPTYLDMPECQVGLDSQVKHMLEILDVGGCDVRMVGIWGIGGIGKTTIAKAVYNAIAHKFDGWCFLANVREGSVQHGGLINLQNIILSSIVGPKELIINNVHQGTTLLRERMQHKKVLLVVDDVDSLDQLKKLAGSTDWFGRGSRVIITTRDKRLLTVHGVKPTYDVHGLGHQEAIKLFSSNALLDIEKLDADEKPIVTEVVHYAGGVPLALEVLGSHLCDTSVQKWRAMLDGFKKDPPKSIQDILLISYDGLQDTTRNVFLDIACFFKGWNRNDVIQILEGCDRITPEHSIKVLEQKALIFVGRDGAIRTHDLLEEMGKVKVLQESMEAGERSRLWYYKDVHDVLTKNRGTSKIEGIIVKMPTRDEIRLSPKCFKKMENLKIFINVNGRFIGNVKYYPDRLRLLYWPECPLEYFPSDFDMKKMVQLNMHGSRITCLEGGFKSMKNLTSLELSRCEFLTQIPDMSGSPNLEFLDLSRCSRLEMVHPSVGYLEKLVELKLRDCCNLVKLPPEVNCRSLQHLDLDHCSKLESFPEIVGEMKCMTSLTLSFTGIKTLPSSIRYLINLEELSLNCCRDLTDLPRSIYELQNLVNFNLGECPKLVTFPTKVDLLDGGDYLPGCNSSKIDFLGSTLFYLNLSGGPFFTLPECIMEFFYLSRLTLRGCTRLVEIPELPPLIRELDVSDCVSLERISKLSNILERKESQMIEKMDFTNCWRLSQHLLAEMAASKEDDDLFSRLLCSQLFDFTIIFPVPRSKFPNWFSCQMDFMGHRRFEFWIEALPNFKWGNNTGLALCVALDRPHLFDFFDLLIYINEVRVLYSGQGYYGTTELDHVWVGYISLAELWRCGYMRPLPPFTYRVVLHLHSFSSYFKFKSCGIHLIMPPNEDVCMKLIRAENLTSERFDDEVDSSKGNWERYRPKHRNDCKELYTDALQQNQEQ
ncbi:hypothetical protein ACLB2K_028217 [Fragaria x ananassa]